MDRSSDELELFDRLADRQFRREFFAADASREIAEQLVALRRRRRLSQKELADLTGMKQPAISRVESSEYRSWSFATLLRLTEALDARVRILIEAFEDVQGEYRPAAPRAGLRAANVLLHQQTQAKGSLSYGIEDDRRFTLDLSHYGSSPTRRDVSTYGRGRASATLSVPKSSNELRGAYGQQNNL